MHDNDHPRVLAIIQILIFGWGSLSLPLLPILIVALRDENIIMN